MVIESKRGKKTSSEKIVEVITKKIENPDKSYRDISKETGISHSTIGDILKDEMEEVITSSDKKRDLLDVNLSILEQGKKIIEQEIIKLGKGEGNVKINTVNDIRTLSATLEDAFKQNQLLTGGNTENIKLDSKDIESKGLDDIKKYIEERLK